MHRGRCYSHHLPSASACWQLIDLSFGLGIYTFRSGSIMRAPVRTPSRPRSAVSIFYITIRKGLTEIKNAVSASTSGSLTFAGCERCPSNISVLCAVNRSILTVQTTAGGTRTPVLYILSCRSGVSVGVTWVTVTRTPFSRAWRKRVSQRDEPL